jgi:hypothetical protein
VYNAFNKLTDFIRAVHDALRPYEVQVEWEGEMHIHRAWTVDDALSWLECYPRQSHGIILTRGYRFVASRASGAYADCGRRGLE